MKDSPIKDGNDVNALVREMLAQVLENGLEGELGDELGYTRYDYRNKEIDNSRNGYTDKMPHASHGDLSIDVPRNRNGEFEPAILKKRQNALTQDILIASVDGLTDRIPRCHRGGGSQNGAAARIIHQIGNTTRFVSYKGLKPLADAVHLFQIPQGGPRSDLCNQYDRKFQSPAS